MTRARAALVVGGAGDIGRGVVDALRADGADVAVLDLRRNDSATLSLTCDATDVRQVDAALAEAIATLGTPAEVVCAAGAVSRGAVAGLGPDTWQRVVDISLTSTFLVLRGLLPAMREAGGGAVVTLSSGLARKGYPHGAPYAAAKAGVEALTKTVALEHARDGIRCNCVAPGPISTAMTAANENFDRAAATAAIPMGRLGTVDDVVAPVMFLLGAGASYITGQVLQVNGGMLMP
jgi:NAD(P)-dependent dehydrogenase (short-subunit alcohol dehydrogenase family)